jgi:hypothetical protein
MSEELVRLYSISEVPIKVSFIRNYEFVDYYSLRHSIKYEGYLISHIEVSMILA